MQRGNRKNDFPIDQSKSSSDVTEEGGGIFHEKQVLSSRTVDESILF